MLYSQSLPLFVYLLTAFSPILAHMQLAVPYPINSQYDPLTPENLRDYDYTNPLQTSGLDYPCKGLQNQRPIRTTATYAVGASYEFSVTGTDAHGGGSCQISLSYDNGKTFRVIKSIIGGCPLAQSYNFEIPLQAPKGSALLAWTWQNLLGEPEFYMNCAWVQIEPSADHSSTLEDRSMIASDSFATLPHLWLANLAAVSNCTTAEGVNVVYPNGGPDTQYGGGMNSSAPVVVETCGDTSPAGPAYSPASSATPSTSVSTHTSALSSRRTTVSYTPYSSYLSATMLTTPNSSIRALSSTMSCPTVVYITTTVRPQTSATYNTIYTTNSIHSSTTVPPYSTSTSTSSTSPQSGGYHTACDGAEMGTYKCLRDGQAFAVCNWGQWIYMGSVAAGTICEGQPGDAVIVAASSGY